MQISKILDGGNPTDYRLCTNSASYSVIIGLRRNGIKITKGQIIPEEQTLSSKLRAEIEIKNSGSTTLMFKSVFKILG